MSVADRAQPCRDCWPADGLERQAQCPACGAADRTILHSGLTDDTFFSAPGKWCLWSCSSCRTAYLDPRPTPGTIGLAYRTYYTHGAGEGRPDYAALSALRKLRRRLANGYARWRFGARDLPASRLGVIAAYLVPGVRGVFANQYRGLPRRRPEGARLLDVGCGNGSYLDLACGCGWQAVGVDPDPKAVAAARARGFEVHHGGIEVFDGQSDLFDAITMSHVIEHLHDPAEVLRACHRLLRPGGYLWLETPNIASIGHRLFGPNWRGLEPPRHLVLFNHRALCRLLRHSGFAGVRPMPQRVAAPALYRASHRLRNAVRIDDDLPLPAALRAQASLATAIGRLFPARREFLSIFAQKSPR
ncbi:MAG: class I SAM-dependent methyltransferase [Thermohalobaculum sp.]|nr:class I SAM-dependent methyltransferase [Thermohalobaculum sp.]